MNSMGLLNSTEVFNQKLCVLDYFKKFRVKCLRSENDDFFSLFSGKSALSIFRTLEPINQNHSEGPAQWQSKDGD